MYKLFAKSVLLGTLANKSEFGLKLINSPLFELIIDHYLFHLLLLFLISFDCDLTFFPLDWLAVFNLVTLLTRGIFA